MMLVRLGFLIVLSMKGLDRLKLCSMLPIQALVISDVSKIRLSHYFEYEMYGSTT